jgi:hypothetical protein
VELEKLIKKIYPEEQTKLAQSTLLTIAENIKRNTMEQGIQLTEFQDAFLESNNTIHPFNFHLDFNFFPLKKFKILVK